MKTRVLLGCAGVIALTGVAALALKEPMLFPSLGPTAMLFFQQPTAPTSSARHALVGHAVGLVVGYGCLVAAGLRHAGPVTLTGVTEPRLLAAAASVAITAVILSLLQCEHAPSGATTLIVSLGIITAPVSLVWMWSAVVLLTSASLLINRATGVHQPIT